MSLSLVRIIDSIKAMVFHTTYLVMYDEANAGWRFFFMANWPPFSFRSLAACLGLEPVPHTPEAVSERYLNDSNRSLDFQSLRPFRILHLYSAIAAAYWVNVVWPIQPYFPITKPGSGTPASLS
jgi:hypothetical protein